MTKAENRAAARAYRAEQERKHAEEMRAERVRADLAELARLRTYLLFKSRTAVSHDKLLAAIDDHVELLTGDRRTLHASNHSIG